MDSVSPVALRREMAWVTGALYGSGGLIVALSMLTGPWPGWRPGLMIAVCLASLVAGGGFAFLAARRIDVPFWVFPVFAAAGSVVVGLVVYAGGPLTAGSYGVFYVYVTAFAFYYYPPALTAVVTAFAAATYAVSLATVGGELVDTRWTVIVAAAVVAGGVLGSRGQQARSFAARQQLLVEELRQLDEVRSGLLTAVSHEVRTPLTVISGFASSLREHLDRLEREEVIDILERLEANSDRLQTLLRDLMDPHQIRSGLQALRPEPTDLARLVHTVLEHTDLGDRPLTTTSESVTALVDPNRLSRAVQHLLSNVVRHTPDGTEVRVHVGRENSRAVIRVRDHGPGFDPGMNTSELAPFRQGQRSRNAASPGLGLGLSYIASVVEAHGGRVTVDSRPGGGTDVTMQLPLPR